MFLEVNDIGGGHCGAWNTTVMRNQYTTDEISLSGSVVQPTADPNGVVSVRTTKSLGMLYVSLLFSLEDSKVL
jgi:hypothetical protein